MHPREQEGTSRPGSDRISRIGRLGYPPGDMGRADETKQHGRYPDKAPGHHADRSDSGPRPLLDLPHHAPSISTSTYLLTPDPSTDDATLRGLRGGARRAFGTELNFDFAPPVTPVADLRRPRRKRAPIPTTIAPIPAIATGSVGNWEVEDLLSFAGCSLTAKATGAASSSLE